jgi:hypothetical protein
MSTLSLTISRPIVDDMYSLSTSDPRKFHKITLGMFDLVS